MTKFLGDDATFHTTASPPFGRQLLTAATTFEVNQTSGNDANNGLTTGTAFQHLQNSYNTIVTTYDFGGQTVTIHHASGQTITNVLSIATAWVGGGALILDLGGSTWNPTSNTALFVLGNAVPGALTLQNAVLQTTTSGSCVVVDGPSRLFLGTGLTFGACAGVHIIAENGAVIEFNQPTYTINGGAAEHFLAQANSTITWTGQTVTVSGTPAFSGAFAFAFVNSSAFFFGGTSFTGAATGIRYLATGNATLSTNSSANPNFFPGSTPGVLASGGQYL